LYEEFGGFFAKKLNGAFCCGIWDNNEKKLLLARDQLGIKSLYYTTVNGSLLFASEIKSLLQYANVKRELDPQSLHYLLGLEFIPGDRTLFKGIKKLPPGYVLIYKEGNIHFHKYWDLTINIFPQKSEEYYINCLLDLLKTSVNRRLQRLPSDVSVGSFLSGGMDTSSIVAMMRNLTDRQIKTFCIGFGEPTDDVSENYARIVADHFETEHHELIIEPRDMEILPKVIYTMDEPHIDVTMYLAREFASKHVKVVFDGRGGDELFGGQSRSKYFHILNPIYRFFPESVSTICTAIISKLIEIQSIYKPEWDLYRRYLRCISSLGNKEKFYLSTIPTYLGDDMKSLYSKELLHKNLKPVEGIIESYFKSNADFLNQALLTEIKTKVPEEYLVVANRLSLAHSMIEKVPLLDINLVNFSFTIPAWLKIKDNTKKYIFKKAMTRLLPKEVVERGKGGSYGLNPYTLFKEGFR
jgi:asparagine synthase (glutamine-hydrolysing)